MKIRIRSFDAKKVASKILSGELPPETDSLEVIDALLKLAPDVEPDLTLFLDLSKGRREVYSIVSATEFRETGFDLRPSPRHETTT